MTSQAGNHRTSRPKSSAGRSYSGFTLIELALVAVLILVMVGLAAPSFRNTFSGLAVKDTALSISKLISYAQERAVIERKYYKVSFDYKNGLYQLFSSDGLAEKPVYANVPGRLGRQFSVPTGVFITGSAGEIAAYPSGMCDEFIFNVVGRDGDGYTVTIKGVGTRFDMREVKGGKQ